MMTAPPHRLSVRAPGHPSHGSVCVGGRYTLERLLGQGGMGAVYVAVDGTDGRRIALKRLAASASPRALALFEREYEVLASLRHPSIVEAYDYGRDGAGAYYTMELVDGSDLAAEAPMSWRLACIHLRDVASILGLLHARRLIHRDLSPRNLIRAATGRLKLIDFGALAAFGPVTDIVGTAPFIPPEALGGRVVDQRYDLFSLGALGYWLITGVHAFSARTIDELQQLWQHVPAPASRLVALRDDPRLEPVPAALDELLAALLRTDPVERPINTIELIDRLHAIADLGPESSADAVEGYLRSTTCVGRARELTCVSDALHEARAGRGRVLLVESEHGLGRSLFLAEAATAARLAGVLALSPGPTDPARPFAGALAASLLAAASASEASRRALSGHAALLGQLSPPLHTLLGGGALTRVSTIDGETSLRVQHALTDLFLTLAAERPVLLAIDDLHLRDLESQAIFLMLAHAAPKCSLVLLAAARSEQREPSAALSAFRKLASRIHLLPLTGAETETLLRSAFGSPPYLERVAARLHAATGGNPASCLELARQLVQRGAIRYQEGGWVLPPELSEDDLPATREAHQQVQIERLSIPARALARALSVPHHGEYTSEICAAFAGALALEVEPALTELTRAGVLRATSGGVDFAHRSVQSTLERTLRDDERRIAHLTIARALAAERSAEPASQLHEALHWLHAGEERRAYPLVLQAAASFGETSLDASILRPVAPLCADIEALLRARNLGDHACSEPLALLALAGYFVDSSYAIRYGDEAVHVLSRILKLPLARRLSRFIGRRLALFVALAVAGVGLSLHRGRGPALHFLVRRLMMICAALAGTAVTLVDPARLTRLAEVIEPFTVLGANHAATVTHRFVRMLGLMVQDRFSLARTEVESLLALLERGTPIRDLPAGARAAYVAGCLHSLGVNAAWHEGDEVLRIADRLEEFGALFALCADHLRGSYYARRGDLRRAEQYQQKIELHAIQLGSTWQVETWAVADLAPRAFRTRDVMLLKRVSHELARLSQKIPTLARDERYARGAYLAMRGQYARALPLLDDGEEPLARVAWSLYRSALAMAHAGLGDYTRAREVCRETIAQLAESDLDYVVMTLQIQLELAEAEAGLGDFAAAHTQLDALFQRVERFENPLTLAALHEVRCRVALRAGDFSRAREALAALALHVRALQIPSLHQLVATRARELDRAEQPSHAAPGATARLLDDASHQVTHARLLLGSASDTPLTERAQRGLQVALELSSADYGFILLSPGAGARAIHLGFADPAPELVHWARDQLELALIEQDTLMEGEVATAAAHPVEGVMRYCVAPLTLRRAGRELVAGALVLGFEERSPVLPRADILQLIAERLTT